MRVLPNDGWTLPENSLPGETEDWAEELKFLGREGRLGRGGQAGCKASRQWILWGCGGGPARATYRAGSAMKRRVSAPAP
jgi:hypothetical protein